MKPVFADSSYFIALLGEHDAYHDVAAHWSENHLGRTFVTEYVLVELGSAFASIGDRGVYVPFVEYYVRLDNTVFVPASMTLFQKGLDLFAKRSDKEWSLVDCISFIVMTQHRLLEALTTNHHFEKAGFKALLR